MHCFSATRCPERGRGKILASVAKKAGYDQIAALFLHTAENEKEHAKLWFKALKPGDDPNVTFSLGDDKAVAVYAYCNLHGLWMTEV